MSGFLPEAVTLCSFLLTYLVHSTVIIVAAAVLVRCLRKANQSVPRVLVWKLALILPVVSTFAIAVLGFPHVGAQSLSLFALHAEGQQPSPLMQAVCMPLFTQTAAHVPAPWRVRS